MGATGSNRAGGSEIRFGKQRTARQAGGCPGQLVTHSKLIQRR